MASNHKRNIGPMQAAQVCGARKRRGGICGAKAISGKKRCRHHGGRSPGAPVGNTHALKHGIYTKAWREEERQARELVKEAEALLAKLSAKFELDT